MWPRYPTHKPDPKSKPTEWHTEELPRANEPTMSHNSSSYESRLQATEGEQKPTQCQGSRHTFGACWRSDHRRNGVTFKYPIWHNADAVHVLLPLCGKHAEDHSPTLTVLWCILQTCHCTVSFYWVNRKCAPDGSSCGLPDATWRFRTAVNEWISDWRSRKHNSVLHTFILCRNLHSQRKRVGKRQAQELLSMEPASSSHTSRRIGFRSYNGHKCKSKPALTVPEALSSWWASETTRTSIKLLKLTMVCTNMTAIRWQNCDILQ